MLVTGGFHQFADPVAEQLGFERVVGEPARRGRRQADRRAGRRDHRQRGEEGGAAGRMAELGEGVISLATGDGANDIPMLEAATYGIAFRAKPKARAAANGWIDRGDLTAILATARTFPGASGSAKAAAWHRQSSDWFGRLRHPRLLAVLCRFHRFRGGHSAPFLNRDRHDRCGIRSRGAGASSCHACRCGAKAMPMRSASRHSATTSGRSAAVGARRR